MADYSTRGEHTSCWTDLIATIIPRDGSPIEDIDLAELSWNSVRTRGIQRKRGRKYARTKGSIEHTASMTLFISGWKALRAELITVAKAKYGTSAQVNIGDVQFDIVAKRKVIDSDEIETVKIEGCMIDDVGESFAESDDPDQVSFSLNPMQNVMIVDGEEVVLG
jgi:hypothetical protein